MACSKYELGYDDNRFEIEVSESFHCIICFLVLKDPVMCKNQHHYCSFCIKMHLKNSAFCPTCREPLSVDTLIPTQRIVMDYLSELNIRCDFHPRGCLEVVKLKNLERHVASCGFSPAQCSNEGCNALVNQRDKLHHQSEICEFRKSKCHDCGQLKQEVKELRVQMLKEQDQIKDGMKEIKEQVKNEVKKEIKEMTFQMLARHDLVLVQQNQLKVDMKEMKELTVQILSRQEQKEMKSEIFARQDQMKEDIKACQEEMKVKIKLDLTEMKSDILSELREIVKMVAEDMAKKINGTSEKAKNEIPTCSIESAGLDGRQEAEMPTEEDRIIPPEFGGQITMKENKRRPVEYALGSNEKNSGITDQSDWSKSCTVKSVPYSFPRSNEKNNGIADERSETDWSKSTERNNGITNERSETDWSKSSERNNGIADERSETDWSKSTERNNGITDERSETETNRSKLRTRKEKLRARKAKLRARREKSRARKEESGANKNE